MSTSDSKKARKRKSKKSGKSSPDSNTNKPHKQSEVTTVPEIVDAKASDQLERLTAIENDTLGSPLPRGTNPYLGGERCLLCQAERLDTSKSYQEEDVGDTLSQLHLWVCSECRKTVEEEEKRASEEPLLLDQELSRLEPSALPLFGDLGSEPTTPNGTLCTCEACTERRKIETQHEQETQELQKCWMEVRHVVRFVYREAGTGLSESGDCDNSAMPDVNKMKELIHRLCSRDPHQLYQRLESQGREYVIEMKVRLLKQLTSGHKTPPQAKQFVSMLLEEYSNLYAAAKKLAAFLAELETEHLKRFNLTWELHNKHLFQSIIYTDPLIQNSLPMLITQLRLGAASKEEYHQDTYPNLLHRYLKFDDEMSVISVVWRDCEQLLEDYNDEQTALKAKQKMLKEDWEFFKQQRKLLEQQIMKNKPLMKGAGDSNQHSLDAQFTETMRHIFQGTKPTAEKCLCPNCNRERCPCDECTISHIITCGIINPEVAEAQSHHHHHHHRGLMIHDPNRYVIDVKPPSMPSTTSSSGSSSPIIVDERPIPGFDFNEGEDEIPEEIEDEASDSDDESYIDEENEEDEEEEETEPTETKSSSGQMHLSDLNYKALVPVSKEAQDSIYDGKLDIGAAFDNCDCNHCAKAKLVEQLKAAEENKQNQCQCHACLQQSGQAIVTSLPQQLPTLPPASLHLYPHIHGSNNLHMGLQNNPAHMRPLLQPHLYELHSGLRQAEKGDGPHAKNPGDLSEMELNHQDLYCDHYCNANGEWDNYNTALDSSAKLMLKYSGNNMGSGLLDAPPPPLMSGQFTSDQLAMTVSNESIFASALKSNPGLLQHNMGKPVSSAPGVATSLNFSTSNGTAGSQANPHSDLCFKNLKPINRTLLCNQSSSHVNPHTSLPSPSFSGRNMNTVGLLSGLSTAATPMTATTTTVTSGSASHTDLSRNPFLHTLHSSFNGNHVTTTTVSSSPSHLPALTPELIRSAAISAAKEEAARSISNNGQLGSSQGQVHTCSHAHSHINNMNPHNTVSGSDSKTGHTPNTSLPSSVSSTSVGTSTPGCNDPDCDGHHDDNYDSIDDSCSEQSSSASTSNQKDGKYCDCCYCEFFGHNPPMTPTSRNYAEMRDRLRLRLKKKKEQTTVSCSQETEKPKVPPPVAPSLEKEAPLDQRGLEELIKFINGGEEGSEKQLSAKAAKRARQKQRKAEEKAKKVAEQQQKELQQQLMLLKEAEEAAEREREARNRKQSPEHSNQKKKRGKNKDKENTEHNPVSQTPEMNGVNHSHSMKSKKSDQAECLQARATLAQKQVKSEQSKQVITKQVNHTGNTSQQDNPKPEKVHKPKQGNHSVESPAQSRKSSVQKNAVKDASIFEGHHGLAQAKQYARLQQAFAHVDPRNHIQASLTRNHENKTCIQSQNNMRHQQVSQAMKVDTSVAKSAINSSLNNHHHHHNKITQQQQQHQQQLSQQTATLQQQVQQNRKKGKKGTQSSSPTPVAPLHCTGEQCKNSQNHCHNQQGHHARSHPTKTSEIQNPQRGPQTVSREVPRQQVQKSQQNGNVTPRHTSHGQARKESSPDKKSGKEHEKVSPREEKSPPDVSGGSAGKSKKNKRKNKSVDDVDEIFMPKEDIETVELDESEREIEEFKRFCLDSTPLAKKEKVPVNMNLKDIFSKKKSGISCA